MKLPAAELRGILVNKKRAETSIDNLISQLFRSLPKFVYVGDTKSFRTAKKPVLYNSKHNFGVFLCTPTYCVRHENEKASTINDILH